MANNEISIIVSLRDQASREFNKIAASSDAAKSKISSLKNDLMAIGAGAGVAGLGMYMANAAISYGKAVDDIVDQTGAAGEEASKLLAIAKATGIGTEEATKAMAKFGKTVSMSWDEAQKAAEKGEESNDIFSRLGITLEESDKTNLAQTFQKVTEKMRNMSDGADKDRVAMELFGKSGYELHDMLNLTEEEIAKITKKAEDMGLVMSTKAAADAEKLDRQINALKGTTGKLAIAIGSELLPVVQEKVTWLQQVTDEYTKMDDEQRKNIATVVEIATEVGAFILVVEGLTLAFRALAMANPWAAIATGIGAATLALYNYNTEQAKASVAAGSTPQYDPFTGMAIPNVGTSALPGNGYKIDENNEGMGGLRGTADRVTPVKSSIPTILRPAAATGGSASDRAQHDFEKAQEKITDMIADMQSKIVAETGSTLEANLQKVASEISKMQLDIQQAADKGVDVSEAQAKLDEFSAVMKDKYVKTWHEAWQDLKDEQYKITAELLDDKNAQADAEYQITVTRLNKERDDKLKAVQVDGQDTEARLAVEKEYNDKLLLADRERQQKKRENTDTAYQQAVEHNNLLITLEEKSQVDIDALNREKTVTYIAELKKQLENTQLTADERLRIEKNLADAQKQIWEMNGRDLKTGWDEAIRQFNAESINYADYAKNSIDDAWSSIDSSVSGHLENIFSMTESVGSGIKGVISDISKSIAKMFADMVYQQTILSPLKSWFGSILVGMGGGGSTALSDMGISYDGPHGWLSEVASANGYATGGIASGWSLVGERGPELVNFTNPGRVYTANDTRNMMSGGSRPVNINVYTPDANSFRESRGQVASAMTRAAQVSARRNG